MAAATAVFDTYELLENIISRLPPFDITRALRVAKAWYNVIKDSAVLCSARILIPRQKLQPHVATHTNTPTYTYGVGFHDGNAKANPNITSSYNPYDTSGIHYLHASQGHGVYQRGAP